MSRNQIWGGELCSVGVCVCGIKLGNHVVWVDVCVCGIMYCVCVCVCVLLFFNFFSSSLARLAAPFALQ